MWSLSFVFVEPAVVQHYQHWHFLALMKLPRQLNIICTDMVIPIFLVALCALTFGMKTLSQAWAFARINLWFSWLIIMLFSLLQVKMSLVRNFLFVAYSILLGCYALWPSLQLL
jgi:hypothetical protein